MHPRKTSTVWSENNQAARFASHHFIHCKPWVGSHDARIFMLDECRRQYNIAKYLCIHGVLQSIYVFKVWRLFDHSHVPRRLRMKFPIQPRNTKPAGAVKSKTFSSKQVSNEVPRSPTWLHRLDTGNWVCEIALNTDSHIPHFINKGLFGFTLHVSKALPGELWKFHLFRKRTQRSLCPEAFNVFFVCSSGWGRIVVFYCYPTKKPRLTRIQNKNSPHTHKDGVCSVFEKVRPNVWSGYSIA